MNKLDLAELIGILLGDGCIGVYRTKAGSKIKIQHRIKITLDSNVDSEYALYVKILLDSLLQVNSLIRKRKGENTLDVLTFRKHAFNLLVNQIGLKISPKKHHAVIPADFQIGELGLRVLRGYCDTDGSLVITNNNGTVYPRIEMKVCPSPMLAQFVDILTAVGFKFGVYRGVNEEVRLQINGFKQLIKWERLIGFSNLKHVRKYQDILQTYKNKLATASAVASE